jgi:acyl-CoA thioesterase
VAVSLGIDFSASARLDEVLTARAREVSRTRRTAVYDVSLTRADGDLVAVMRGRVQRMPDAPVDGG